APLTSLSMANIKPQDIAQSSGLLNVIRQIGGSFGIAVMGTELSHQVVIHTANFGQAINSHSPILAQSMYKIEMMMQQSSGRNPVDSMALSRALLLQNAADQAFVQAICDDFMIAGIVTFVCLVPLLLLKNRKKAKGVTIASME